jgi:hypothetical protein
MLVGKEKDEIIRKMEIILIFLIYIVMLRNEIIVFGNVQRQTYYDRNCL